MSARPTRTTTHRPDMVEPVQIRGLGDIVALAAKPVVAVSDRVLGTDLAHCGGCASRRAALNAALPNPFTQ